MDVAHEDAGALLKPRVPGIKTKMAIKTKMGLFRPGALGLCRICFGYFYNSGCSVPVQAQGRAWGW